MCDQRERLIGYVYDECEPSERALVQQHLDACADCRAEISALRSVREDLQAWEVPDHESVWRPFAPAPAPSWWSQVPRWALAAAAGVVLVSGAAGGAVAHALLPHSQPAVAAGATQAGPVFTAADLAAMEQRLQASFRTELDAMNGRVQLTSSRTSEDVEASFHRLFDRQLADLRAKSEQQLDVINGIYNNLGQMKLTFDTKHGLLQNKVEGLQAIVLQQSR